MLNIAETFNLAVHHHQNGNLAQAEPLYRQIIQADPAHADALYLLGILGQQTGHHQAAISLIRQAIALKPNATDYHFNLGNVYREMGQWDDAINCYRQVLVINPGQIDAANNLGLALIKQGQLEEAIAVNQQALRLNPNHADLHNNLGIALAKNGQLTDAIAAYQQALLLNPNLADAQINLGVALKNQGKRAEAIACYRQALLGNPNHADAYNNLANVYYEEGQISEAEDCYRQLLRINPVHAETHNSLGNVLKDQGRLDEAIACYQEARKLEPSNQRRFSNFLYSLLFHPRYDAPALLKEHRRWEQDFALPLLPAAPSFDNDPSPERRLRIGYISPFFWDQVVGRNVWPLLNLHDRQQFEITLYAHLPNPDDLSEQFRNCADHWCAITEWRDDWVADRVRRDRIDILVDLNLHLANNRLLVFARKPAPVQVTFAGYPGTTGLSAIDYRLTDPHLDPPGQHDSCYAETSERLPHSFWCYEPHRDSPAVGPLPALEKNSIAFGCLNNFCKINDQVLELWTGVMREVTGSRLLLLTQEGNHRQRTRDSLARHGIQAERIDFVSRKTTPEYLALYHQIDISLDTFPYNGHTTSLDAFWMGVPVITLVGDTVVGRGGLSQLTNLGLQELAANSPEEFIRLATALAGDLPRLTELRAGLRERMRQSPLMDAQGFTRGIESAYRSMWHKWCAAANPGSADRG